MKNNQRIFSFFASLFFVSIAQIYNPYGVYSLELPDKSIYQVQAVWHDERGAALKLSGWKGHFVVLSMAYTHCKSTCPITMQRLKKIQKALRQKVEVEFVVVSFDPQVDTSEILATFKEGQAVNWHFLTGKESDVRVLSQLLGVSYEKNPESGEIMHSNKIILLDRDGVVVHSLEGLNADIKPLIDIVNQSPETHS